jgi:hypothetical protein
MFKHFLEKVIDFLWIGICVAAKVFAQCCQLNILAKPENAASFRPLRPKFNARTHIHTHSSLASILISLSGARARAYL